MEDRRQRAENVQADEQRVNDFAFADSQAWDADPKRQRDDAHNAIRTCQADQKHVVSFAKFAIVNESGHDGRVAEDDCERE